MKKFKILILALTTSVLFTNCNSQISNDVEKYYSNTEIFKTDTIFNDVLIDGEKFTVKVLSDKLDEHLEPYKKSEDEYEVMSPKTLVFFSIDSAKIAYVKKFDFSSDFDSSTPSFKKLNGNIHNEGKLYLNWLNHSNGSGFRKKTYYVYLENGKLYLSEILESGELSYTYFNKNDKEILVFDGIWNFNENETHFSNHRYKITSYKYSYDGFVKDEYGTTYNKYPSDDEGFDFQTVLPQMKTYERILPNGITASDYKLD